MYVDYAGQTAQITDRETGELRKVKIFVAVLGYSNLTYTEATMGETTADWISAQVRALEYCGGVPKKIVPDNPKALITPASRYEPDLNPNYQEFAEHFEDNAGCRRRAPAICFSVFPKRSSRAVAPGKYWSLEVFEPERANGPESAVPIRRMP